MFAQVFSGLANRNCCDECQKLYTTEYWEAKKNRSKFKFGGQPLAVKVIDNENTSRNVNFPRLIDPGMPDYAMAKLRWRFDGLQWQGGWVSKPAGLLRQLYESSKNSHKLKYQTYELVLDTTITTATGSSTKAQAVMNTETDMKKQSVELDELKAPAVATPKAKVVAKKVAKAAPVSAKKVAAPSKATKNGEFTIRAGSKNEQLYNALKSGKAVTREALGKLIGPSMVGPYVKGLIDHGIKIQVLDDGAKFQLK